MPLYEYQCTSCNTTVKYIQSFSDNPKTTCENCGGKLKKLIHASRISFKGPGFYITDNAKTTPRKTSPKSTSPKNETSSSDSSKK